MTTADKKIEISIASDFSDAKKIEETIIDLATQQGYDEDSIFALRLSLEEALVNAIRHGNKEDSDKKVHICYTVNASRVDIWITDEGNGFCPDSLPDPTCNDKLEIPSGRGVLLMRAYMDLVEFNESGNSVHLTKFSKQQPTHSYTVSTQGNLQIAVDEYERYTAIHLKGSADMAEAAEMSSVIDKIIEDGKHQLIMDIKLLDFICSMGLGTLIKTQTRCGQKNGSFHIVNPQPAVQRILKTTRLDKLFSISCSVNAVLMAQS